MMNNQQQQKDYLLFKLMIMEQQKEQSKKLIKQDDGFQLITLKALKIQKQQFDNDLSQFEEDKNEMVTGNKRENETDYEKQSRRSKNLEIQIKLTFAKCQYGLLNQKEQCQKIGKKMNQTTKDLIFCDNHTNKHALVMKYDQSGIIWFQCLKCLCNDQSQRSFIYLEDLIDYQNDQMIDNWPLLNDQQLFEQFYEIKNKQKQQSTLSNFICQMEQLEKQVIERFAEYKKNFINKFERMNGDQVTQKWNEISQITEFKQIFSRQNIDRNLIQQFLLDKINNIQSNSELIQNEINLFKNEKPQNLDQLNILCKNIHFEFDNLFKKEQVTDIQDLINQQN
ncbi:hypothetical protein ABPG72_022091, partial [Tetrahymena utriculariae]